MNFPYKLKLVKDNFIILYKGWKVYLMKQNNQL